MCSSDLFTKILAPVIAFLRRQGILLYVYLDDILIRASSRTALQNAIPVVLMTLALAGFIINIAKSDLEPCQDLVYIGGRFRTDLGLVVPPQDRIDKLHELLRQIRQGAKLQAVFFLRCLGLMSSMTAVVPFARMHMRYMQLFLLHYWRPHRDPMSMLLTVPESLLPDVRWWRNTANLLVGVSLAHRPSQYTMTTDASLYGWGGHLDSHEGVQGLWTPQEKEMHINVLELLSVRKCMAQYLPILAGKVVLIRSDNTTTVAYINKQGGTRSHPMCAQALLLWQFCIDHQIDIRAVHAPGLTISLADMLSRRTVNHLEWSLHPQIAARVFRTLGQAQVDWFATSLNTKLPLYGSLYRDPAALAQDAFQANWFGVLGYLYPPVKLIPIVLQKIVRDRATAILIAPHWPRRIWYSRLLNLVIAVPRLLPARQDLLSQTRAGEVIYHPQPELLRLVAWKVSGDHLLHKAFLTALSKRSSPPGRPIHGTPTILAGEHSAAGVIDETVIPIWPL